MWPVQKIATHVNPHIDEICGIWLLRKFGNEHFPGIKEAVVEFFGNGNTTLQMTAEECLEKGIILVGIGGGMFDEHPTITTERKNGKCATTLIAEYLSVDDNPALEQILKFVCQNDLKGSGSISEIASICLKMYKILPAEKVGIWANLALETIFHDQEQFNHEAADEFKKARIFRVGNNGDSLRIAVVESDNEVIAKFARSKSGGNSAIVIQKQSSGNVQIFLNRKFGWVKMDNIAKHIRLAEQKVKGRFITLKEEDLKKEGSVPGAEEWHFFKKGQMILNGSMSHPDVPASKISLQEIIRIVVNCA